MPVHDWTRVSAGTFHHFHNFYVPELCRVLNDGLLPPGYYAMTEQLAGRAVPDVLTLQVEEPDDFKTDGVPGGLAVATAPPQVSFSAAFETDLYARRQRAVTVRTTSGDRVVAMLEVVSPGNKASRYEFDRFIAKAYAALTSGCHLLLIDLFPPGRRDPNGMHGALAAEFGDIGFTLPPGKPLTLAAYSAGAPIRYYVQPAAVGDSLCDMPLFLTAEVYIPVPLEATYARAWAAVPPRWRDVLEAR